MGPLVTIIGPGHMTKMAAVPIYGKNLKIGISVTDEQSSMKLGIVALWTLAHHSLYKSVLLNHDLWLT